MVEPINATVRLRFVALMSVVLLASGCTITREIVIEGPESAAPAGGRLPVSVDLVLSPDFRSYVQEREINRKLVFAFPIGSAGAAHLEGAAKELFQELRVVDDTGPASEAVTAADAVMRIGLEEFQYFDNSKGRPQARVTYRVDFRKGDGTAIGSWSVAGQAAGAPPESSLMFANQMELAGVAATGAIRTAAANLATGFSDVPEVARWLRDTGVLPGGPRARTATGRLDLAAEGYSDANGEIRTFNSKLSRAGILAVELSVGYSGPGAVLIRHGGVRLRLEGGAEIASSPTNDIFERTKTSDVSGAAGFFFGPLADLGASAGAAKVNNEKMLNYETLRLKDATLRDGSSVSGIAYFILPDDIGRPLQGASVQVGAVDIDSGIAFGDSIALSMKPPLTAAEVEAMREARKKNRPIRDD